MKLHRTETDLVRACIDYLTMRGHVVWRQNSGAFAGEYKGKKRFVKFNGMPGCSDIIGFTSEGTFIGVECKIGNNQPTNDQNNFLKKIEDSGGIAVVAYSVDDVERALRERQMD